MLHVLSLWCAKWHMKVNTDKTQILHFRNPSVPQTSAAFLFDNEELSIVQQYKYLGLIFTEFLDYQKTAKMVAKSASRALGLLIAKSKASGGMPYEVFTKLYNALVQPVLDYGAGIWGTREFSCINSVQHRACRFYLGLGKYTPNVASEGEMGWPFPQERSWLCVTRLWCRLRNMDDSRLNKRIYQWAK